MTMTMTMTTTMRLLAAVAVVTVGVLVTGELERIEHPSKSSDESVSFLVVGDWGRQGYFNQSLVAHQMGIVGEKLDVDFIVSVGDNFYDDGLTGIDDSAFEESFTNIYTAPSLQKPWYTVLGNHDYRGDALAQLSPVLKQLDPRWICKRSFIVNAAEVADLFFVDTTPFADKYFHETKVHSYDWRGVLPRHRYLSSLLKDVDVALRESSAKWKIVVGHHTIMSAGHHGNTEELVTNLLPLLQENDVDLYINGHDHCLEHISSPDRLQFLTSGGGSKAWRGDVQEWDDAKGMKFYYDGQGFMSVRVTSREVGLVFYDVHGNALHTWSSSKSLYPSA